MNLNERIEAGRTNEVAKSFQAASEMIEKNTMDPYKVASYEPPMGQMPSNAELGRRVSAQVRKARSRESDGRLTFAIAMAVINGASSLKALAEALNEAKVPTRRGTGEWTVSLAWHEMNRTGRSVKSLRAHTERKSGLEPTVYSERAFWRVVEAERKIAEFHGSWQPATEVMPASNDPVRHPIYGEGTFEREIGQKLYCRFRKEMDNFPIFEVAPSDVLVFKWNIDNDKKKDLFSRVYTKHFVKSELVTLKSLTREQLWARKSVTKWP
jgi:hypothetical protein